jgi:hypothetical protein
MTKTDFFRLIIKVFGLYALLMIVFSSVPRNFSYAMGYFDFIGLFWMLLSTFIILFIIIALIFKSDSLIFWLKLDKGFDDEKIDLKNFNELNVIKLGVILIGGVTFIQNLPDFLSYILIAFKASNGNDMINGNRIHFGSTLDFIHLGTSFFSLVIGYLLITNVTHVSNFLYRKNAENTDTKV